MNTRLTNISIGIGLVVFCGCSAEDDRDLFPVDSSIPIHLTLTDINCYSRAPGDAAISVNRVLIIPFRKTNESLSNDPANFIPEYNSARQLNVGAFPTVATMLNLSSSSTYQLAIIGYNQSDYDFMNQNDALRKFSITSASTPATLANVCLQPSNATVVPEFFSCIGIGYMNSTMVGPAFRPSQINNVKGTLVRLVSGLSLQIKNVPGYVKSIALVGERLVTGIRVSDAAPLTWQTAGDGSLKTLGTRTPVSGSVNFNLFLLPTTAARSTQLYLDVTYGSSFTERYTVKVPDSPGVVSSNRITFDSNHWVKITGNYSSVNLGFTLAGSINLDDNDWDGIKKY